MNPFQKWPEDTSPRPTLRINDMNLASGRGEILLKFLFAAMEACWIDAILIGFASLDFLLSRNPLLPLWSPFVFIAGAQWLFQRLEPQTSPSDADDDEEDKKKSPSAIPLFSIIMGLVTLLVIWTGVYASTFPLYDPRWLASMLNDILLLNLQAYRLFTIIVVACYLCWRGIRISEQRHEPSHVFAQLRIGIGVMLVVIIIRAGQFNADAANTEVALLLLIPIFLYLALSAHALARISFVRRTHSIGLEGSIEAQKRAVIGITCISGIILLLIAFIVDSLASSVFAADMHQLFAFVGQVYTWIVNIIAFIAAIIVTPFFWLFSLFTFFFPPHLALRQQQQRPRCQGIHCASQSSALTPNPWLVLLTEILRIAIPLVLIAAAVFLIVWALRRRQRRRLRTGKKIEEVHESLWSWRLFWTQLKGVVLALWRRFFPRAAIQPASSIIQDDAMNTPTARSIREIYRALLNRAATRGYPRMRNETPYEFRERLDTRTPLAQPQIVEVTEAYTAIRYGGIVPDEAEVAHVREEWVALEQKWK